MRPHTKKAQSLVLNDRWCDSDTKKSVRTPRMLYRPSEDKNINRLWVLTTKTLAFSLATLITFLNLPLRLPPKDQRSQKVHWGICPSALFHYVPSKRSCLHQMLRCVACLLLPGTVITREPSSKRAGGKRSQTPLQWPAYFTFSLSHLSPISS